MSLNFESLFLICVALSICGVAFICVAEIKQDKTDKPTTDFRTTIHKVKQYEIVCTEYKEQNKQCVRFDVFKVTEE